MTCALCSKVLFHSKPEPISDALRYSMIVLSLVGFTVNDLFYVAAIINYALQCQLITFLIYVTKERISNSHWKVDNAIKVSCNVHVIPIHSLKYTIASRMQAFYDLY